MSEALLSTPSLNTTSELKAIVNIRRLYNSCIDENAIETNGINVILSLINEEFGGWPILQGSTWNNSTFNLSRLLLKLCLYSDYSSSVIFKAGTQIDATNSSLQNIRVR